MFCGADGHVCGRPPGRPSAVRDVAVPRRPGGPPHKTLKTVQTVRNLLFLLVSGVAFAQSVSIQIENGSFRLSGWNAAQPAKGWASVFAVYAGAGDLPPMLGSYSVQGGSLIFRPSFPLAAGVHYRAVFRPPNGGAPIEKTFDTPARDSTRRTRIEHVYPSADMLPGNILRLYIYFSAPMSRGEAARRIRILDENGKDMPGIFLPGQELWDPAYQRLTMTFDPGRIKRGLTSNEAMGAPITEGKRYRLVIDRDWPDAHGVGLVEGHTKWFRGGPADRNPPDPKQWRITSPRAGTIEELAVELSEPMNYPLLLRMLRVANVQGSVEVDRQEMRWRFTPQQAWKAGDYELLVDSGIEDLAGNKIGQPFDIDMLAPKQAAPAKMITLSFRIQ